MSGQKGGASLHGPALLSMPWEKSTRAPFDAAQTQGSQHLKEHKIYSLSILLHLLCLIKTAIELSHFLSGLSYKDPEGTLQYFFLSHLTPQCKTDTICDGFLVWKTYTHNLFCTWTKDSKTAWEKNSHTQSLHFIILDKWITGESKSLKSFTWGNSYFNALDLLCFISCNTLLLNLTG